MQSRLMAEKFDGQSSGNADSKSCKQTNEIYPTYETIFLVSFFSFFFFQIKMKDLIEEEQFLATKWLFLLRFGLPILEDLSQNIYHFNLLCRTYFYCLEILSPSHYSNRLAQLDRFYHNLAKHLLQEFYPNKDHCDLNFHIPTHYIDQKRDLLFSIGAEVQRGKTK